jgi:hypothetical protein
MLWWVLFILLLSVILVRRSYWLGLLDHLPYYFAPVTFFSSWGDLTTFTYPAVDFETVMDPDVPYITMLEFKKSSRNTSEAFGSFKSPVHHLLPEETSVVHFQIVAPHTVCALGDLEGKPLVIHLAATGDEGFSLRNRFLATPLASEFGYTNVILQIPFYGKRRTKSQMNYALPCVSHVASQSAGCITEAVSLGKWCSETLRPSSICYTGISYGGSMAALAASYAPFTCGCCSLIPAGGPQAFLHGVLNRLVDFDALANDHKISLKEVKEKLSQLFYDTVKYPAFQPECKKLVYCQISARHDKYIPETSMRDLWMKMSSLSSETELIFLPGGHLTAVLFNSSLYLEQIRRVIQKLK